MLLAIQFAQKFSYRVYQTFQARDLTEEYDLVHAITPILPRYPVPIVEACKNTPFVLGPVNGGVPFPKKLVKNQP